jgi:DNA polymerase I
MKARFFDLLQEVERDREQGTGSNKNSHILIIDGLNTFIRVFSAVPALNDDGMHIGGVTGFLRSVASAIRQHKPTRCIIVFDGKGGSTRRKSLYPNYKANRAVKTKFNRYEEFASLQDEQQSMKQQFGRMVEYLQTLPITTMAIDQIEADDAIAYIANEIFTEPDNRVTIVSTDRDFLQLVNERITVWSPVKKIMYTPAVMREEFGLDSKNYLLYRALTGDKSDNIPGINGVGLKTMLKAVSDYDRKC